MMKKHAVDDLFKKKLSTLERQPSSDTWARISAGTNKPERKLFPGWVWYAAASIVLALIAGYSVWENGKKAPSTGFGDVVSGSNPVKIADALAPVPEVPVKMTADDEPTRSRQARKPVFKIKPDRSEQVADTEEIILLPDNENPLSVAVATPEESQVASSVQLSTMKEVQLTTMKEVKSTNRTIVVNVTIENDSLEQPKASRFTRVFRQLKNVRAGEPVNWDEVGFNPRAVIARVDGKHNRDND